MKKRREKKKREKAKKKKRKKNRIWRAFTYFRFLSSSLYRPNF